MSPSFDSAGDQLPTSPEESRNPSLTQAVLVQSVVRVSLGCLNQILSFI